MFFRNATVRRILRLDRRRRTRQPRLLAQGPAPDPRLSSTRVDPNARFLGDQMGQGGGERMS